MFTMNMMMVFVLLCIFAMIRISRERHVQLKREMDFITEELLGRVETSLGMIQKEICGQVESDLRAVKESLEKINQNFPSK